MSNPKQEAEVLTEISGWDPGERRRAFLGLCLAPALTILLFALVYPLIYNVILSLSDANIYHIRGWKITGFRQYALVFAEPEFWIIFSKTMLWTAVSTFLQVVVGLSLAIVLHQSFFRVPKIVKDTANVFIVFKPHDLDELGTIGRRCGLGKKKITWIFETYLPKWRDSLCINLIPGAPHKFCKNLFEPLEIKVDE